MIVDRVINNNIVSTIDDEGAELILMGRGLGFGAKSGNDIDESKVEKIFKLEDQNDAEQLKQLLLRVPLEEAEVVGDIVSYAKEKIAVNLNSSVYVTLTDKSRTLILQIHYYGKSNVTILRNFRLAVMHLI